MYRKRHFILTANSINAKTAPYIVMPLFEQAKCLIYNMLPHHQASDNQLVTTILLKGDCSLYCNKVIAVKVKKITVDFRKDLENFLQFARNFHLFSERLPQFARRFHLFSERFSQIVRSVYQLGETLNKVVGNFHLISRHSKHLFMSFLKLEKSQNMKIININR